MRNGNEIDPSLRIEVGGQGHELPPATGEPARTVKQRVLGLADLTIPRPDGTTVTIMVARETLWGYGHLPQTNE